MTISNLAMFGGEPIRSHPYSIHSTNFDEAEEKAVLKVLRGAQTSGFSARAGERFLGGEQVQAFEEQIANKFGTKYAITFNSATSALHGCMAALGVGPGDEVITSPYTMSATSSSILMANGIPVFADIETRSYGIDPVSVESLITPQTKAILAVNIFGHPARLNELNNIADKYDLVLVEDNAQAPAVKYFEQTTGTVGKMAVLSFNYHKAIQTGEGGAVITNDKDYALRLQLIRNHAEVVVGDMPKVDILNMLGWNYRLTEIQAAIGIEQLAKLDFLTEQRQNLASYLTSQLNERYDFLFTPIVEQGCGHGYYLYPMRFITEKLGISRQLFVQAIQKEGVAISEGYVKPIYLEPMYQNRIAYGKGHCPFQCPKYKGSVSYDKGICPNAEKMHFEELVLTDICKYPNSKEEVDQFIQAVDKIVANIKALKKLDSYNKK